MVVPYSERFQSVLDCKKSDSEQLSTRKSRRLLWSTTIGVVCHFTSSWERPRNGVNNSFRNQSGRLHVTFLAGLFFAAFALGDFLALGFATLAGDALAGLGAAALAGDAALGAAALAGVVALGAAALAGDLKEDEELDTPTNAPQHWQIK